MRAAQGKAPRGKKEKTQLHINIVCSPTQLSERAEKPRVLHKSTSSTPQKTSGVEKYYQIAKECFLYP
jgi:hypothetical protein